MNRRDFCAVAALTLFGGPAAARTEAAFDLSALVGSLDRLRFQTHARLIRREIPPYGGELDVVESRWHDEALPALRTLESRGHRVELVDHRLPNGVDFRQHLETFETHRRVVVHLSRGSNEGLIDRVEHLDFSRFCAHASLVRMQLMDRVAAKPRYTDAIRTLKTGEIERHERQWRFEGLPCLEILRLRGVAIALPDFRLDDGRSFRAYAVEYEQWERMNDRQRRARERYRSARRQTLVT